MNFTEFSNPDKETHLRVYVFDMHKEPPKTKVTSLVMEIFGDLLGVLCNCAITVFSISGFGGLVNV